MKHFEVALQANAEKLKQIGIVPEKLTHNNITSRVSLLSPITGVVSKVNINIGKYINPADVLFEIVNPSDIHLRLSVFEKDVNLLSIGQSVDAYPANNPAYKYKCEVILVNRDIAPDRSLEVHCHFKQPDTFLVPGMYMTAYIEVNTQNAIVLPKEAIVAYGSQSYIFISVNKNKFEMLPVTTGVGENGYLQVIPPVGADILPKNIVIEHAYTLLMKVKNKGGEEE